MTKEVAGPQVVKAELDHFIELLFRESEAYRLALKLYIGRYEIIAGSDAATLLRQVIAERMPGDDEQAQAEKRRAGNAGKAKRLIMK